jgi:hypothetical protein
VTWEAHDPPVSVVIPGAGPVQVRRWSQIVSQRLAFDALRMASQHLNRKLRAFVDASSAGLTAPATRRIEAQSVAP